MTESSAQSYIAVVHSRFAAVYKNEANREENKKNSEKLIEKPIFQSFMEFYSSPAKGF